MTTADLDELKAKHCVPCEGGVPRLSRDEAAHMLQNLPEWELSDSGDVICRRWTARNFAAAVDFFNRVARLAEDEGHHPDLHLTGYRNAKIELSTHAIGGLSENDFILAAKIEELPIDLKS